MTYAIISGTKALIVDNDLKSQLKDRGFGELEGNTLSISLIEALFLVETKSIEIMLNDKPADFEEFLKYAKSFNEEFYNKYLVYKDLRERGMLVRTGLKFGTDFRTYERGGKVGKSHSKYLIQVVPEEYTCSFPEMAKTLRLAKTVHKDIIYAIVDGEGDITYYLIDRMKL